MKSWRFFSALANLPDGSDLFEQQFPAFLIRDACCRNSEHWGINKTHEVGYIWCDFSSKYSFYTDKFNCHKTSGRWLLGQLDSHTKTVIIYSLSCHFKPVWMSFSYEDWGCQTQSTIKVVHRSHFSLKSLQKSYFYVILDIFVINRPEHNRRP